MNRAVTILSLLLTLLLPLSTASVCWGQTNQLTTKHIAGVRIQGDRTVEGIGMRRDELTPEVLAELNAQMEALTEEEWDRVEAAFAEWPDNQFFSKQEQMDFVDKVKSLSGEEMKDFVAKAKRDYLEKTKGGGQ